MSKEIEANICAGESAPCSDFDDKTKACKSTGKPCDCCYSSTTQDMSMILEDAVYCVEYCLRKATENIHESIIPHYQGEEMQSIAIQNALKYLKYLKEE